MIFRKKMMRILDAVNTRVLWKNGIDRYKKDNEVM